MEKIAKSKAEQILIDGGSIRVKIKGIGTEFKANVDLVKGEIFRMDIFLFKLLRLYPGVDRLPNLEFYVNIEPVRVTYSGRFIIRHAVDNRVLLKADKKISGYKQLVRYVNAHYMKVINKGHLLPNARRILMF
jgi:hypothetical protein